RNSPTSSWARPGSAEMSTYAVTMTASSLRGYERLLTGVGGSASFEIQQRHATGACHELELVLDARHGRRKREHLLAHLHVSIGGQRMPEHAIQVHRHFGDQVGHAQNETLPRVSATGEWPH